VAIAGVVFGAIFVNLWLARYLSVPHQDDNRRARKLFYIALILTLVILALYLLIDAALIYRFGRLTYTFWEAFLQVWLTWQTMVMLLAAAICFTLVVAIWTRFFTSRPYKYMLIWK
jgi:hypothetical protein